MADPTLAVDNPIVAGGGDPAIDAAWIILTAFIIFTMETGFALLEAGMVTRRNEANAFLKTMVDVTVGGLSFWFIGFGFAFGDHNSHGTERMTGLEYFGWENQNMVRQGQVYTKYFFQLSFAVTATTIFSGAVAERMKLPSYIIFVLFHTGFIYPFPAHWMWHSDGWLAVLGAYDLAGCGVIHLAGGTAALVGILLLGPRHKRFGIDRKPYTMASPANVLLGTFFLWWGWIGFNCGSTFGMTGSLWKIASRVAVVTMNGAFSGGVSAIALSVIMKLTVRHYFLDIPQFATGILGGLVGVTAGASVIEPWHGLIVGFIGGWIANGGCMLLNKLKIDDPVGAVGVHFFGGFWGLIAVGLFAQVDPIAHLVKEPGCFRGGDGHLLGSQIAAALAIIVWSAGLTAPVLLVLKFTLGIRMELEDELKGSDFVEHDFVVMSADSNGRELPYISEKPARSSHPDGTVILEKVTSTGNDNPVYMR